jgi:hypothetical protein
MSASSTHDILAEVWAVKDSLSASYGHDLKATCRALYAEQQKHPEDFVNLGSAPRENVHQQGTMKVVPQPVGSS